jgi:hypothetical protein
MAVVYNTVEAIVTISRHCAIFAVIQDVLITLEQKCSIQIYTLTLFLTKLHAMKTFWTVDVSSRGFLIWALDADE